ENDASYSAVFAVILPQYIIYASSTNTSYGSVVGSGIYDEGSVIEIRALSKKNYRFSGWTDGNTDNPRVITVTGNASYQAEFILNLPTPIVVTVGTISRGSAFGGGMYDAGSEIEIYATANEGYEFEQWNDGNTDNPRIITVTEEAATYIASFTSVTDVESTSASEISAYPNPTKGLLMFSENVALVEVFDNAGRMLSRGENVSEIDLSALPAGMYNLRLATDNAVTIKKIVKE
ncbi:MAG: T9SS type A sorting domain-containing protein, partial [Bacteroidales bacterium]|nr:T9SS type A sorting domain-containing protein [Bacteroidales bacterium]